MISGLYCESIELVRPDWYLARHVDVWDLCETRRGCSIRHGPVTQGIGDVFRAQCDVEPGGCTFAWILLVLSVAIHAWRCCAFECDDDSESDDETNPMYT